jgi:predicted RNase H-like nuclease (RuvC/YqgF family)
MEVKEFDVLQKKIEDAKKKKSMAEGALEQIRSVLKKEFGVETVDQAKAKLKELQDELSADQKKFDEMARELEAIVDWGGL